MEDDVKQAVWPLVVLARDALSTELNIPVDELPPSVTGVLLKFAVACHRKGVDHAFEESTQRFSVSGVFRSSDE